MIQGRNSECYMEIKQATLKEQHFRWNCAFVTKMWLPQMFSPTCLYLCGSESGRKKTGQVSGHFPTSASAKCYESPIKKLASCGWLESSFECRCLMNYFAKKSAVASVSKKITLL